MDQQLSNDGFGSNDTTSSDTDNNKKIVYSRRQIEYIYKDPNTKCMRDFPVKQWIADGMSGSVFVTCIKHDCKYVIKLVPLDVYIPTDDCDIEHPVEGDCLGVSRKAFETEVEFTKKFSDLYAGPKMVAAGICDNVYNKYQPELSVGFIVQEKWDLSLEDYLQQYPDDFQNNFQTIERLLLAKAKKIDKTGYCHIDLHSGNILLRLDSRGVGNTVTDVTPSDFGIIRRCSFGDTTVQWALRELDDVKKKSYKLRQKRHKA